MEKIYSIINVGLRKSEIPETLNAVISTVEKFNPTALKIEGVFNMLVALQPTLNILTTEYDGLPISPELAEARNKRNRLLGSILSQLAAIEKGGLTSTASDATIVLPFLRQYLSGISNLSPTVKSGKVNQLMYQLETEEEATKTAMTALGLLDYVNELKLNQQRINELEQTRRVKLSARKDEKSKVAREKIAKAMDNLLMAIEVASLQYPDIDYVPVVNELNVIFSARKSAVKSRTTRNKNAADKTTTVALSPTTTATAI